MPQSPCAGCSWPFDLDDLDGDLCVDCIGALSEAESGSGDASLFVGRPGLAALGVCSNCSILSALDDGLCSDCWLSLGSGDDVTGSDDVKPYSPPEQCGNCGAISKGVEDGLCPACTRYLGSMDDVTGSPLDVDEDHAESVSKIMNSLPLGNRSGRCPGCDKRSDDLSYTVSFTHELCCPECRDYDSDLEEEEEEDDPRVLCSCGCGRKIRISEADATPSGGYIDPDCAAEVRREHEYKKRFSRSISGSECNACGSWGYHIEGLCDLCSTGK